MATGGAEAAADPPAPRRRDAAPSVSEALRGLVAAGAAGEAPDVAEALAAASQPRGAERFWAASAQLLGLTAAAGAPGAVASSEAAAESLLLEAVESEEALEQCPDCAALWAFGRLHGAFAPARPPSLVARVARAGMLTQPAAAYALAAERGGSLGRLAWGQLRAGGAVAAQHTGSLQDPAMLWALPQEQAGGSSGSSAGLMEALEMAMAVASAAMAHEHTAVPQPIELDHWRQSRLEDRQSYALADQLAASGDPAGLAAKAEMLLYGREGVVPGGGTLRGDTASSVAPRLWAALLLVAALLAPWAASRAIGRFCSWRRRFVFVPSSSPEPQFREDMGRCVGCLINVVRALLCASAALLLYWSGPMLPPPGALPRDEALSRQLFREAADAGHWGAAYALALLALDGANRSEATPWLQQVVDHGEGPARVLAEHFQLRWGFGAEKNALRAGELLQQAAELGEPNAALLLAEAHAHPGDNQSEVEFQGGRNLSLALRYYRQAAAAGRSTCRYNIGAILVRQSGEETRSLPAHIVREAREEFVAVATDLDPTVRLLFALGVRAWELGDQAGALKAFMLLSEAGSVKAHRNAARLWEEQVAVLAAAAPGPEQGGPPAETGGGEQEPAEEPREPGLPEQRPAPEEATCTRGGAGATALQLVHEGRYCCPGGDCHAAQWLLNEGGVDPAECIRRCGDEPRCSFATVYATGFCQLSHECDITGKAGDPSAATYALASQTLPRCAPPGAADVESPHDPALNLTASWCWPSEASAGQLRNSERCSMAFHVRAAGSNCNASAPAGSAAGAGVAAASEAALAAARHLERLSLPGVAHAWNCEAGKRFGSEQGRVRCAALEAEEWEGHSRDLAKAVASLSAMAAGGEELGARLAAYFTLAWLWARFALDALRNCRLVGAGSFECPGVAAVVAHWGAPPISGAGLERGLTLLAAALLAGALGAALLAATHAAPRLPGRRAAPLRPAQPA